jgi:hypothetical protein
MKKSRLPPDGYGQQETGGQPRSVLQLGAFMVTTWSLAGNTKLLK